MSGRSFLIFILFFNYTLALANDSPALELEPIIVIKSNPHIADYYSLDSHDSDYPGNSILEILDLLPLDLQSRSPKKSLQSDFSLRGSTYQGVSLLLGNARINDPQTAHHNCDIPVTAEDIEKIEIIPGASSSLFGPDAIGGAVNIQIKKPRVDKTIFELSGGSHKTNSGIFSLTRKIDNWGFRISSESESSDGFYYDTDFKKLVNRLDSSLEFANGEFNLGFGYQEKEFGAYDFYTPGLGYPSKEWTKTYLLNSGLVLENEDFIFKPGFLWRSHYDKFMLDKTQSRSTYLNHHHTDIYTPSLYLQKDIEILGKVGLGLEYGEESINSTNLGKHGRRHKSIFIVQDKDLNSKSALRLSFRCDDFRGFECLYTGASNLRFDCSESHSLNFGIGNNVRIPSFTELYYNDPTTQGNESLSEEKALNYQLGYGYKKEGLTSGIVFFLRQEKDMLDWVKADPSQAKWQIENIKETEVKGIETYLKFSLDSNFSWDVYYTYINKRIIGQDYLYKYGPSYMRHLVSNRFQLDLPFGRQVITAIYKKRPARRGWFLLDTYFNCRVHKNAQLFLNITNILNVEYQEIEGIPQPGRWIEAGFRLEW
ncbi:MAG: hypothetical protein DRP74_07800 [Candidatus Omnitrophota bacterium]|nr:MAG: hypothetical protein DRP74_07800 [Candidatus Omnitrophota bacterium]